MWKIVKAELSYMHTEWYANRWGYLLLGIIALVIIVHFTVIFVGSSPYLDGRSISQYNTVTQYMYVILRSILYFVPLVFLVMQGQLLAREQKEKRVKLQYLLPLGRNQISFTRLLTPLMLFGIISFVAFVRWPIKTN